MSIEDFKTLMDGFDPASLLPNLDAILSKLAPIARIAVMIGPVAMLMMGLIYLFLSPKEANHYLGYRCYYGMGSVEAWKFTQRLAGIVWGALGLTMSIVMLIISAGFGKLETVDLLWRAVYCVAAEAGLVLAAWISVNATVAVRFDGRGDIRKKKTAQRR